MPALLYLAEESLVGDVIREGNVLVRHTHEEHCPDHVSPVVPSPGLVRFDLFGAIGKQSGPVASNRTSTEVFFLGGGRAFQFRSEKKR